MMDMNILFELFVIVTVGLILWIKVIESIKHVDPVTTFRRDCVFGMYVCAVALVYIVVRF